MILRPTPGRAIPTAVLPASPRTSQSSHHNAPNKGQSGPFGLLYIWPSLPVGHAIATPCRMLPCIQGANHLHTTTRPSAANMTAWRVVNKAGRREDLSWKPGSMGMGNRPASPLFARRRRPWKHHGARFPQHRKALHARATETRGRPDHRHHRRHQRHRPCHSEDGGEARRAACAGGARRKGAEGYRDRYPPRRRRGDLRRGGCRRRGRHDGGRGDDAARVRRVRHLGQQCRRLDLRQGAGHAAGGPAPPVRDQLLGRGDRLPHRRHPSAPPRRRPDQSGQRPVGPGGSAAGGLLRVQARGQGLHQRASAWSWRRRARRYRSR